MLLGLHIGSEKIAEDFLVKEKVKFWTVILTLTLASESFLKEILKKSSPVQDLSANIFCITLICRMP